MQKKKVVPWLISSTVCPLNMLLSHSTIQKISSVKYEVKKTILYVLLNLVLFRSPSAIWM